MGKSSRREGLLFLAGCLLWFGSTTVRAQDTFDCFISKDLLDHAGLSLVWQNALPVKKGEKLETMQLLNERLYIRSDRNYTWSLGRNDGKIIFSRAIAPAGFVIPGWTAYEDRLIGVIDNRLVQLDLETGIREAGQRPGAEYCRSPGAQQPVLLHQRRGPAPARVAREGPGPALSGGGRKRLAHHHGPCRRPDGRLRHRCGQSHRRGGRPAQEALGVQGASTPSPDPSFKMPIRTSLPTRT